MWHIHNKNDTFLVGLKQQQQQKNIVYEPQVCERKKVSVSIYDSLLFFFGFGVFFFFCF